MLYIFSINVAESSTIHLTVSSNIRNVATSTINITGFQNIEQGFNLTNACFRLSTKSLRGKSEADLLSFIYLLFYCNIFCQRAQCKNREKRQGCNNQDNHKCHQSEG